MKGTWTRLALLALGLAGLLTLPAAQAGPQVTVLLHHPNDGVDPFGFDYAQGTDYFAVRYGPLVADKQRFDFPFFVADGVLPIETLPDPDVPFEATRAAYEQAVALRSAEQAPATLHLASTMAAGTLFATLRIEPAAPLAEEDLHLLLAVTEDPVHYQPPPKLTNGITEHRFTVRAVADLGAIDLTGPVNLTRSFSLPESWDREALHVAAWLQQGAGSPRFDAREVVQATSAPAGQAVTQDTKGVLLEMLSATWCKPCLYGDLAAEAVAVDRGAAQPLVAETGPRYFQPPVTPWLAFGLAAVAAVVLAGWGGGRQ